MNKVVRNILIAVIIVLLICGASIFVVTFSKSESEPKSGQETCSVYQSNNKGTTLVLDAGTGELTYYFQLDNSVRKKYVLVGEKGTVGPYKLVVGSNGELLVRDVHGGVKKDLTYQKYVHIKGDPSILIQDDGNVVVYRGYAKNTDPGPWRKAVWSSREFIKRNNIEQQDAMYNGPPSTCSIEVEQFSNNL